MTGVLVIPTSGTRSVHAVSLLDSGVIPWLGFPLADLIGRLAPTSRAKYVEFTTLLDPKQLPGEAGGVLPWPYVEALRIDEATNPLAFLAIGLRQFRNKAVH